MNSSFFIIVSILCQIFILKGSGENFLFTFYPSFKLFKATMSNEMYQIAMAQNIAFGGEKFGMK
jgi:hypothetical protein